MIVITRLVVKIYLPTYRHNTKVRKDTFHYIQFKGYLIKMSLIRRQIKTLYKINYYT